MKNAALILVLMLLTSCYTVVEITKPSSRRIVTTSYTPPTFYYSSFLYPWDSYYPYSYDRFYFSYPNYYSYYYNPYRPLIVVVNKKKEDKPIVTSYTPPRNTPVRTSGVSRYSPTPPTSPTQIRKTESTNTRGEVKRVETTKARGEVKKTEAQPQRRSSGESRTNSESKGTVRKGS